MDKHNRKKTILWVLFYLIITPIGLNAKGVYFFTCLCNVELIAGFEYVDEMIIDKNLKPIKSNLKEYNKEVQNNIDKLQENNELLKMKIKLSAKQLLGLQEYLHELKITTKTAMYREK